MVNGPTACPLTSGKLKGDYGFEAYQEILEQMTKKNEDPSGPAPIWVFAGYSDKMREFVKNNPGMQSRVGPTFTFKAYTPEELTRICLKKLAKMKRVL